MTLQLFILWIVIFFAPLMPTILTPLGYSLIGVLLTQQINPWTLSIITVWVSTIEVTIIRMTQNYVIERFDAYKKKEDKGKIHHLVIRIYEYFRNQKNISNVFARWKHYAETRNGKFATFLFAVFCFIPVIPDIISVRLLYKKIEFPYFLLAVLIGKSFTFIPIIFLGRWLLSLLNMYI